EGHRTADRPPARQRGHRRLASSPGVSPGLQGSLRQERRPRCSDDDAPPEHGRRRSRGYGRRRRQAEGGQGGVRGRPGDDAQPGDAPGPSDGRRGLLAPAQEPAARLHQALPQRGRPRLLPALRRDPERGAERGPRVGPGRHPVPRLHAREPGGAGAEADGQGQEGAERPPRPREGRRPAAHAAVHAARALRHRHGGPGRPRRHQLVRLRAGDLQRQQGRQAEQPGVQGPIGAQRQQEAEHVPRPLLHRPGGGFRQGPQPAQPAPPQRAGRGQKHPRPGAGRAAQVLRRICADDVHGAGPAASELARLQALRAHCHRQPRAPSDAQLRVLGPRVPQAQPQ
ncbi:unnamed protein product, partial [Prorocentrum cordatum]